MKPSHYTDTSQQAQCCPTQTNQLIETVHSVAAMYRVATIGLEGLNRSSYKTEKLFEQYPWGWYGLSPIAHFFIVSHLLEECEEF